jgi:hypothetical protein
MQRGVVVVAKCGAALWWLDAACYVVMDAVVALIWVSVALWTG